MTIWKRFNQIRWWLSAPFRGGAAQPQRAERRAAISAAFAAGGALALSRRATASTSDMPSELTREGGIDIRAFGAKGDRQTDDYDAIKRAVDRAGQTDQYPVSVRIPAGNFRRRAPIALPHHMCLTGSGIASVLNSQNDDAFDAPILVNEARGGLISARISDLSLFGGSHAIRLQAEEENADLRLNNVSMALQRVANLEANRLLQTAKFTNCVFANSPWGIRVPGMGTNCFYAAGCEWTDHTEGSIVLGGADGVTIVGGRFEGGGERGRTCIDISNGSNLLFMGCFFENVHEYLGRFRNINGGIVFQSCHFSGTKLGGKVLRPFRWDPGDAILIFRDCVSLQPMAVGKRARLEGHNVGILAESH